MTHLIRTTRELRVTPQMIREAREAFEWAYHQIATDGFSTLAETAMCSRYQHYSNLVDRYNHQQRDIADGTLKPE